MQECAMKTFLHGFSNTAVRTIHRLYTNIPIALGLGIGFKERFCILIIIILIYLIKIQPLKEYLFNADLQRPEIIHLIYQPYIL